MTIKTTSHLFISRPVLAVARLRAYLAQRDPLVLIAAACLPVIALLIAGSVIRAIVALPTVASVPTPQLPIIIVATSRAEQLPTPAPIQVAATLPNTFQRAVVAYDAPNGNPLGAIEQGRAYRVLARWGSDWLQADVTGSGVIWLKSADVFDLPSGLADLQPQIAPVIVERPIYIAAQQPPQAPAFAAPTPAPPPIADERTLNIQPPQAPAFAAPTPVPTLPITDVEKEWIRVESCAEHPDWCP